MHEALELKIHERPLFAQCLLLFPTVLFKLVTRKFSNVHAVRSPALPTLRVDSALLRVQPSTHTVLEALVLVEVYTVNAKCLAAVGTSQRATDNGPIFPLDIPLRIDDEALSTINFGSAKVILPERRNVDEHVATVASNAHLRGLELIADDSVNRILLERRCTLWVLLKLGYAIQEGIALLVASSGSVAAAGSKKRARVAWPNESREDRMTLRLRDSHQAAISASFPL
jgi:hypothetical protein